MTDNASTFSSDEFLSAIRTPRFASAVLEADRDVENHITNMLYGTEDGWKFLYRWITIRSESSAEERWAGLLASVSFAKRTIYTVTGEFPAEYPESLIRTLVDKYDMNADAELGLRDGLYIMTVAQYPDETLESDWVWYATPDCPSSRYNAIVLLMFILVGQQVRNLSKAASVDVSPVEMWEGLRTRL